MIETFQRARDRLVARYQRLRQFLAGIPVVVIDGIWAALLCALSIFSTVEGELYPDDRTVDWVTYFLTVAIFVPLVTRRAAPIRTLATVALIAVVYQFSEDVLDYETPVALALMVSLYTVAAYRKRKRDLVVASAIALALGLFQLWAVAGIDHPDKGAPFSGTIIFFTCCLAVGAAIGNRRAVVEGLKERARLAEVNRAEEGRRLVDEERLRIARELHDVVAHSLATISIQAGVASHLFDSQPEQARSSLIEIRRVSKDALQELRATLGVLRSDGDDDLRTPSPGLEQIAPLIERMRAAGLRVEVELTGSARRLPPTVDLAAYRIVQEALTNVVRHAGAANVSVTLDFGPDRLDLAVRDDGRGATGADGIAESGKHGLLGMRERAASVGGKLSAGPREPVGFEVRASLPVGEVA